VTHSLSGTVIVYLPGYLPGYLHTTLACYSKYTAGGLLVQVAESSKVSSDDLVDSANSTSEFKCQFTDHSHF
jgi:hypothetical protein